MPNRSTVHPQADTRRVLRALDAAGFPDAVPDVRAKLDHAEHLTRSASEAPRQVADLAEDLARQLAAGTITADEAGATLLETERAHAAHSAGVTLLRTAGDIAANAASAMLAAQAEALIADVLQPRGHELVAVAAKAGEKLPQNITSADAAMAADATVRRHWAQLHDAAEAWRLVTDVAWALHNGGFTKLGPQADAAAEYNAGRRLFEYRNPDQVLSHIGVAEPLVLLQDIRSGAEPEVQTVAQLRATEDRVKREMAAERDAAALASRSLSDPYTGTHRARAVAAEVRTELAAEAASAAEPEDAA